MAKKKTKSKALLTKPVLFIGAAVIMGIVILFSIIRNDPTQSVKEVSTVEEAITYKTPKDWYEHTINPIDSDPSREYADVRLTSPSFISQERALNNDSGGVEILLNYRKNAEHLIKLANAIKADEVPYAEGAEVIEIDGRETVLYTRGALLHYLLVNGQDVLEIRILPKENAQKYIIQIQEFIRSIKFQHRPLPTPTIDVGFIDEIEYHSFPEGWKERYKQNSIEIYSPEYKYKGGWPYDTGVFIAVQKLHISEAKSKEKLREIMYPSSGVYGTIESVEESEIGGRKAVKYINSHHGTQINYEVEARNNVGWSISIDYANSAYFEMHETEIDEFIDSIKFKE